MPLTLNFAIICEGNELETYDVKQEGPNSRAFVASRAGKQFYVTYENDLLDIDLSVHLYMDGECIDRRHIQPGRHGQILGVPKTASSVLPFKFQELELVDPDVENALVVPKMGMIELRTFRCRALDTVPYRDLGYRLHQGRVSERSKKAGWHHVSTADEIPTTRNEYLLSVDYIDSPDAPYASVKVFYRPRELLMAQGVITGHDIRAGNENREGSEVNDRKRAREDGLPGPSKRRTRSTAKKEEKSALSQQIQSLQTSLVSRKPRSAVKRELRSLSPIVVGQATGEVIDLTLED